MEGVVSRVGLQLLLEPSSTAVIFRGACIATGAVYPAYATYKTIVGPKRPAPSGVNTAVQHSLQSDQWLKYWTVFGLAYLTERLLEGHIHRVPYYPHAKFAFLLWLQLHDGHGASLLFDGFLVPWLRRYERKVDTVLEVGAQLAEMFYSTYAGPLSAVRSSVAYALAHVAGFIKWLSTPDDDQFISSNSGIRQQTAQ
eukprot:GHRR01006902.1.p1 GENE.GHRR01006902.1~~GHRR01006902.1.p1  ORF type:complete len:197 (+),score=42.32 GHRR01006902.1:155-745(+)